tara:strand:- start:546 stop:929 length:384 start_codon:yes stop_codon:yes gene_type:complete
MNQVVRVLLVDNDLRFLENASAIFIDQGVEVLIACDPDQVHSYLNGGIVFDAVIADLSSPFFGSPKYCQSLVTKFPLVAVSASDEPGFLDKFSICDCVLGKEAIKELLYMATIKAVERHHLGLQMVG